MTGMCLDVNLKRPGFQLDVRAHLPGPGVTAILGGSGSGKSTLLRLIAGLEKSGHGRIGVAGREWSNSQSGLWLAPQKRSVGMVFQDYALFRHMSVLDNIAYGLTGPHKDRLSKARDWVSRVHLEGLEDRSPDQLSGGQRQRVALARALAPDPDVVLLDEPFSAVDSHLKDTLMDGLKALLYDKPRTVLMVTHALAEAEDLADHIGVMAGGKLVRLGPAKDVLDDPRAYEAAKMTGWRNMLAVAWVSKNRLGGRWGALDLNCTAPLDAAWIGIRPERIRIDAKPGAGLPADVISVRDRGPIREVLCTLGDGSKLMVHKSWDAPVPAPGESVGLILPPEHVRPLAEGHAIQLGQETLAVCPPKLGEGGV